MVEEVRNRVFAYVCKRGLASDAAEDVAQEVTMIVRFGRQDDGTRAWDGQGDPVDHALEVAKNAIFVGRRRDRRARASHVRGAPLASLASATPPPDELLRLKRKELGRARLREAFEEAAADDPVCAAVLRLFDEGIDGRGEQAARLGKTDEEMKEARARLKRKAERIARELREELGEDSQRS
jgi:hypothetical protein